jgi:hypothetical protein
VCPDAKALRSWRAHTGWATRRAAAKLNESAGPPSYGVGHVDATPIEIYGGGPERSEAAPRSGPSEYKKTFEGG